MGVVYFLWLALATASRVDAFVGCRPFALPTSNCQHSIQVCCLLSQSRLLSENHFSVRTPSITTLRSDTVAACGGNIGFTSADDDGHVDLDIIDDICDDKTDNAFGLYIHIPYCRQRCRYCDFAIVPIGDHGITKTGTSDAVEFRVGEGNADHDDADRNGSQQSRRERGFRRMNDRYISAVITELKRMAARNRNSKNGCQKLPLRSIYFGGGTPSLAPIESIEMILYHACGQDNPDAPFRLLRQPIEQPSHEEADEVNKTKNHVAKTEITMEMDPGTFDREYLTSLRSLGINRVSLGVQSFDDDLLRAMGRTHRRIDVLQAIRDIAFVFGKKENDSKSDNGWNNVNYSIDLISGCPGLTPAKWIETLQEATAGVETKKVMSIKKTVDSALSTMKEKRLLLLSSLPPPKHISVYDMQIEEGTVFGKWAAKAKEAAVVKRKEGELSNTPYEDEEDEDEDPSRQFTVALPLDKNSEAGGRLSRESNLKQKPNQQQRLLRLPSEDECAFMYKFAAGYLRAKNYEHYEVSSYAAFNDQVKCKNNKDDDDRNRNSKKGHNSRTSKRSVHNQIYWEYEGQWYAVGLGATSFVDKELVARPREMSDYIEWAHQGKECTTSATNKDGENDIDDDGDDGFLSDLLLKRLRTIDGLDLSWLKTNYGSKTVEEVLEGAKLGLDLGLAEHTDSNVLRLTDPVGLLYSNFIISSIFAELGYT